MSYYAPQRPMDHSARRWPACGRMFSDRPITTCPASNHADSNSPGRGRWSRTGPLKKVMKAAHALRLERKDSAKIGLIVRWRGLATSLSARNIVVGPGQPWLASCPQS